MQKKKGLLLFIFLLGIFLVGCIKNEDKIEKVFENLFINENLEAVTSDLDFPTIIEEVEITYDSTNTNVIANDGKVTRGINDETVRVIVILKYKGETVNKYLDITVIQDPNLFINDIYNGLFLNIDLNNVVNDLTFPTLVNGVEISYQSTNSDIVSNEGKVTRSINDETVRIDISLEYLDKVVNKNVDITVPKDPSLFINYIYSNLFSDLDLDNVTENIEFPSLVDDVTISYDSTNTDVITNDGVITRGNVDKVVKVIITLEYQGVTHSKVVDFTIKQKEITVFDLVYDSLFTDVDLDNVTSDLEFKTLVEGVSISYQSSNTDVITNNGIITRGTKDELVQLTLTLEYEDLTEIRTISLIIKKDPILFINDVFKNLFLNIDLDNVVTDLDFVTLVNGVEISYQSTNTDVIKDDGKVIRSVDDEVVGVNIVLQYLNETVNKHLYFTVTKDLTIVLNNVYTDLFVDIDLNNVVNNIEFPSLVDGVEITYQSANPNVISNNGVVTRGIDDETVRLIITLEYEGIIITKNEDIIVRKDPTLFINQVFDNLFIDIDLENVISDLEFPTNIEGVLLSYSSSNKEVITDNGKVTRGNEDIEVSIDISLTYENITINKEIFITVTKTVSYPIIDAINANQNNVVTVEGVVIGNVGLSYFIHDGENGIYLYSMNEVYEIGDRIQVTGVRAVFNGLIQLKDFTNSFKISSNNTLPSAIEVERLSQITTQSTLYSIENLTILKINLGDQDKFVTVKDKYNQEMEIIISKHIGVMQKDEILSKLDYVNVGDKISLENFVSGYYKKFQIQVFNANQLIITNGGTTGIDPYYPDSDDMIFLSDELDKFLTSGIYPVGETNVLIIPINFTDYTFTSEDLEKLELSFFGTSEETGWESVQSYYHKSSYGSFAFNGEILAPFQTNKPSTYYAKRFNNGYDADYDIIKAALEHYDSMIDYSLYDMNNDGFIDGLFFIYATPTWYGDETGSDNDSDLWWAYMYQYYTDDYEFYDGVEANYYLWAGVDFMYEPLTYNGNTDITVNVNATTYIHETGHMLGLYDYYDYEEGIGPDGGLGGADMMDYTVGDHNSFTKIILDWTTPLVVSGKSTTVTIEGFTESGDVILVSPNWNYSYFDEYFLVEFFTPTGLNEAHAGFNGLYSTSGIRIFHVNARINPDQNDGELFYYNNSDTSVKLLKPIEADGDNSIEDTWIAENSDLFQAGDVFGKSDNYKLQNGVSLNFDIKILSIENNAATIEIIFY